MCEFEWGDEDIYEELVIEPVRLNLMPSAQLASQIVVLY